MSTLIMLVFVTIVIYFSINSVDDDDYDGMV